jgi:hypothetical protein
VRRDTKLRLLDKLVVPFLAGTGFVVKATYTLTFAWWLDPWVQRRQNRALLQDLHRDLYFLVSEAEAFKSPSAVLPFDYATVEVHWRNLLLTITRGRGEINVSVAPRHAPNELHELGPLIAALEGKRYSEREPIASLADAAALLLPRLNLLNGAFSEPEYPRTRQEI